MAHYVPKCCKAIAKKLEGSCRLFVKNVSDQLEHIAIQEAFSAHGNVLFAYNTRKGYAFVYFSSLVEAQHVANTSNGTKLGSRTIDVSIAKIQGTNCEGYLFSQLQEICYEFTIGKCHDESCKKGAHICRWCLQVAGRIEKHSANDTNKCPQQTNGYIPSLAIMGQPRTSVQDNMPSARGDHVTQEISIQLESEDEDEFLQVGLLAQKGEAVTEQVSQYEERKKSLPPTNLDQEGGMSGLEDNTAGASESALMTINRLCKNASQLNSYARENLLPVVNCDFQGVKEPGMGRLLFGTALSYLLYLLEKALHQFDNGLKNCSGEPSDRVKDIYNQMVLHEKRVDVYVKLMLAGRLNEQVALKGLQDVVKFFDSQYIKLFGVAKIDFPSFVVDSLNIMSRAMQYIFYQMTRAEVILDPTGKITQVGMLLCLTKNLITDIDVEVVLLKQHPVNEIPLNIHISVAENLTASLNGLESILAVTTQFGKAIRTLVQATPDSYIPSPPIHKALQRHSF